MKNSPDKEPFERKTYHTEDFHGAAGAAKEPQSGQNGPTKGKRDLLTSPTEGKRTLPKSPAHSKERFEGDLVTAKAPY